MICHLIVMLDRFDIDRVIDGIAFVEHGFFYQCAESKMNDDSCMQVQQYYQFSSLYERWMG